MGLLAVKLLVAEGIKTIVAGTQADSARLELAKQMGAYSVVNVSQQDLTEHIKEETDGFGVDVAIECAGVAASAKSCLHAIRPLGHYTQVGHFGQEVTVPLDLVGFKQIRMSGSVGYTVETWIRMLKILEQGKVQLGNMITHKFSLNEWQKGFAACENKSALKVLLHP
jgi:L-iditol 2-dehydrogenase